MGESTICIHRAEIHRSESRMIAVPAFARLMRLAFVGVIVAVIPGGSVACGRPAHANPGPATTAQEQAQQQARETVAACAITPTVDTRSAATVFMVVDDVPTPLLTSPWIGKLAQHRRALMKPYDLRQPRPPRHRGERPMSAMHLLDTTLVLRLSGVLDDVGSPRFVVPQRTAMPLAGHPLLLLRPPAALS
jgi:hypothetical protein